MPVEPNLSTPENREYWEFVKKHPKRSVVGPSGCVVIIPGKRVIYEEVLPKLQKLHI